MTETLIHALITTGIMSLTLFFIYRFVNKSDQAKADEEKQWRDRVMSTFSRIEEKLTSYCKENRSDHDELYTARRDAEKRIGIIENTHHLKGCDEPMRKQA